MCRAREQVNNLFRCYHRLLIIIMCILYYDRFSTNYY